MDDIWGLGESSLLLIEDELEELLIEDDLEDLLKEDEESLTLLCLLVKWYQMSK